MSNTNIMKFRAFVLVCGLTLLFAGTSVVSGQVANTKTASATNARSVPSGSKMKFQGVVISRDADTFTIRDRTRADYLVLITDNTSIKTNVVFLHGGKKYPVTDIFRGLIVEV